jgi:hypothetical protein
MLFKSVSNISLSCLLHHDYRLKVKFNLVIKIFNYTIVYFYNWLKNIIINKYFNTFHN